MQAFSDTIQRRKYPRRKFRRGVSTLCLGAYALVTGFEIGEGGLAFFSEEPLEEGVHLIVNFQIHEGSFMSVRGIVRNKREEAGRTVYGVSFENLKFEWRREIRNFVTARTSNEH